MSHMKIMQSSESHAEFGEILAHTCFRTIRGSLHRLVPTIQLIYQNMWVSCLFYK